MANAIPIGTRVVVVPVCVGTYDTPDEQQAAVSSGFEALPRISEDLDKLRELFDSPRYVAEGFRVLAPITGTAGQVKDELTALQRVLSRNPDLWALLFWSGHGRTVRNELRLLTRECFDPPSATDGIGPDELVGKVADANLSGLVLLLDVCQGAAGLGDAVATAARRAMYRNPERSFTFAALCSAYPFEQAADGFFVGVLVDLLREGPPAALLAKVLGEGRDLFNTNSRCVSLYDVEQALLEVIGHINASAPRKRQTPLGVHLGTRGAQVFPNPRYQRDAPSRIVASARRLLSTVDLEQHFLPKARGLEPGEDGWFFSGRSDVTREVVQWLNLEPGHVSDPLFVVTGDGGTGKSAVIGRIATLSDSSSRAEARKQGWDEATDSAQGIVPTEGCLQAALHLRRMTLQQATDALGELLELAASDATSLVALAAERAKGNSKPLTLMFDALDEADEPLGIVDQLVLPLVDRGWRVLLATRTRAAHRGAPDLLEALGDAHVRSLDDEASTFDDVADYVRRRIKAADDSSLSAIAANLGHKIAERAQGKFLYARITTSALLRRSVDKDLRNIDNWLGRDVADALDREIRGLDEAFARTFDAGVGASALLGALAWSHGEGLPWQDGIWAAVAGSLASRSFESAHVRWILQAAGHLIIEGGDGEQPIYRLYHQSLVDHFRRGAEKSTVGKVAASLRALGDVNTPWRGANPYLIRHLPAHLEAAGDDYALQSLLLDAGWALAQIKLSGFSALLSDYERVPRGTDVAKLLLPALRRSAGVLRRHPGELAAQMVGRLLESKQPVARFVNELSRLQRKPWLRPLRPSLRAEGSVQSMRGDSREVLSAVSLSRNGRWAVYSHNDEIFLLDLQRWESRGPRLKARSVYGLAVSDDARACLFGDSVGRVWTWHAGRGDPQGAQAHADLDVIQLLDISSDGRRGLSATPEGAFAWDLATQRFEPVWRDRAFRVTASAIDSTGQVAAIGFADGTLKLFDLWPVRETGSVVIEGQPLALSFSRDKSGLRLALGTSADWIELRNADQPHEVLFHQLIDSQPRSVAASGQYMAVGMASGTVETWTIRGARRARYPNGHTYEVERIVFAEGSNYIVSADRLDVKQWQATGPGAQYGAVSRRSDRVQVGALDAIAPRRRKAISDVLAVGGGQQIAVVVQGGLLATGGLHEPDQLATLADPIPFEAQRFELAQAEAATRVLAWARSGAAVWDLEDGTLVGSVPADGVNDAAISSDGETVALLAGRQVKLWRPHTGDIEILGKYAGDLPRSVSFSRDGRSVLTCGGSRDVKIWRLDEGERELEAGPFARVPVVSRDKPSRVLCITDDMAVVATGDGALFVINPVSARARALDDAHRSSVYSMLPFDDGRRLATSSADGTVRLWELATGRCNATLSVSSGYLLHVEPVEGLMLMATTDGVLFVISMEDGSIVATFHADKQIISAVSDCGLRSIVALDQGATQLHYLRVELPSRL